MKIQIKSFGGIIPRYNRKKLPTNAAQTAFNCDVSSGSLKLFEGISAADCGGTTPSSISPITIAVPYPPTLVASSIIDNSTMSVVYHIKVNGVESTVDTSLVSVEPTAYGFDASFRTTSDKTYTLSNGYIQMVPRVTIGETTLPTSINKWTSQIYLDTDRTYANRKQTVGSYSIYEGTYLVGTAQIKNYKRESQVTHGRTYVSTGELSNIYKYWIQFNATGTLTFEVNMNYSIPHIQYLSYRCTFEDANGDEGPPSTVSAQVTRKPGEKIIITFGGIETKGTAEPAKIHIYRAEHGIDNEDFYHLATVKYEVETYEDVVAFSSVLGRQLPIYKGTLPPLPLWGNPPASMTDIIQMPSMFYVGYKDRTVYFSDIKTYNHRWPSDFSITLDYDIVKISNSNDIVLVLTEGGCYAIYGNRPYEHFTKELSNRCCVSADAVVKLGENVFYISPDGLIRTNGYTAVLVSKSYFMPADWRELTPSTMTLKTQGDRIFAYTADSGEYNYIFDYDEIGANVIQTDRTSPTFTATQMTWKSKEYFFDKEQTFSIARVLADSYTSILLRIYRNNVFLWEKQVGNNNAFILPRSDPHKYWSVEVIAKSTIHEIVMAQSEDELYEKT